MTALLTHSRMTCAKTCLRKHYFAYELGVRRDRSSAPLRVGGAFHVGLDLLAKGHPLDHAIETATTGYEEVPAWVNTEEEIQDWTVEREIVARLISGHEWRWRSETIETVASEIEFRLPIINPETGRPTPSFQLAGKIDRIVRLPDGRVAVMEHKTCGTDIDAGSDYWRRLTMDQQISLYVLAARALGHDAQTVLYDVTRKPGIRPKKLSKADATAAGVDRETVQMYGDRLTADIADRPDFYFARVEIPRLESDLEDFRYELWQQQLQLREAQKSGRWFRSTNACLNPYPCEYLDICSQGVDPARGVPAGFVRLTFPHPELSQGGSHDD